MEKMYNLEIDGLVIGSCNEEELRDLLKTDTRGFTVHECHSIFQEFLECVNDKFYNFKYILDEPTSESNPHVTVIREMKYKKLTDYKQFWFDTEDYSMNYTSDEFEIEKFMVFIDTLLSPEYENVNIDDFCFEHSGRLYADKINVPDHFPERTVECQRKSEEMMKNIFSMCK